MTMRDFAMIEKHGTTGGLQLVELTATPDTPHRSNRPHRQRRAGSRQRAGEGRTAVEGREGPVLPRGCPVLHAQAPGRVQPRGALETRWEASREERVLLHVEAAWGLGFVGLAMAAWLWLPDIIMASL